MQRNKILHINKARKKGSGKKYSYTCSLLILLRTDRNPYITLYLKQYIQSIIIKEIKSDDRKK